MQFSELLLQRRSIRRFTDQPVDMDVIKQIIQDSTLAPNAGNEQPWKFLIVQNKALLQTLSDECKKNMMGLIEQNPDALGRYSKMMQSPDFNIFYNAHTLVMILGESQKRNLQQDCSLAASYFMMSATSRGLGTCWVNFAKAIKDPELLAQIGVPENHTIVAPLIIGYPAVVPEAPKRNDVEILKVTT